MTEARTCTCSVLSVMSTKGLVRLTTSWWCPNERDFSGVNVKLPAESSVASATLTRLPRLKLRSTTELPGLAPWISPVMVPEGPEADGESQPIRRWPRPNRWPRT